MKGCEVSKLLKLKQWVSVASAARHLSIVAGEEVSDADILRMALDGHLKLSVFLVNGAFARCWRPTEPDQIQWQAVPNLSGHGEVRLPKGGPVWGPETGGVFQLEPGIRPLQEGVWDLPMIGPERLDIEREYQRLSDGPEYTMCTLDGVVVASTNGNLFQLQAHFEDNPHFDKAKLQKPHAHCDNFYPAPALPNDSVLVVRTSALNELQLKLTDDQRVTPETPKSARWPAHETEKLTALRLAAVKFWANYNPARPDTAEKSETVSEWLQTEHNIARTVADAMASILRPDNLKTGPR